MTCGIPIKWSEKMWLMIILKVKKGFNFSLEDTFFEKPRESNWPTLAFLGLTAGFFKISWKSSLCPGLIVTALALKINEEKLKQNVIITYTLLT